MAKEKISLEGVFVTEKHPQIKKSPACNIKSKFYNAKVAKNRKKEKARRRHNARIRKGK